MLGRGQPCPLGLGGSDQMPGSSALRPTLLLPGPIRPVPVLRPAARSGQAWQESSWACHHRAPPHIELLTSGLWTAHGSPCQPCASDPLCPRLVCVTPCWLRAGLPIQVGSAGALTGGCSTPSGIHMLATYRPQWGLWPGPGPHLTSSMSPLPLVELPGAGLTLAVSAG